MRRGTDSLGADVPSEREINRLAARSDEEFRIFEEMDEKRRKAEGYRSRLIEEHEVPEWVFLQPDKTKTEMESNGEPGKRERKEVLYTDVLSDSQWLKAIEDGEDVSEAVKAQLSRRKKDMMKARAFVAGDSNGYGAATPDADDMETVELKRTKEQFLKRKLSSQTPEPEEDTGRKVKFRIREPFTSP